VTAFEPSLGAAAGPAVITAGWRIDVPRLTVLAARDAAEAGAEVRVGMPVVGLLRNGGNVVGVEVRDMRTGATTEYRSGVVVNAAGAGAGAVAEHAGAALPINLIREVALVFGQRLSGAVLAPVGGELDGIRLVPESNLTRVGPLRAVHSGGSAVVPASEDEVARLVAHARRLLPGLADNRVIEAQVVVSARWGRAKQDLRRLREIALFDHAPTGAPGLVTVLGGAVVEHRWVAELTGHKVCSLLGRAEPCATRQQQILGSEGVADIERWSEQFLASRTAVSGLVSRHGSHSHVILQQSEDGDGGTRLMCRCQGITSGELKHAVTREFAEGLDDLARRTGLSRGPCQGSRCLVHASAALREGAGFSAQELLTELRTAKNSRFATHRPVIDGPQISVFAIDQLAHRLTANLDRYWRAARDEEEG